MSTFHQFNDLPKELRDIIWSFVIRDDKPGVHIFGAFDGSKTNMAEGCQLMSCGNGSLYHSAPSWSYYFPSLDENASDKNVSTYLIDGGLWTACKESRLIMETHFRQSSWLSRGKVTETYPFRDKTYEVFKMPATGYFDMDSLHCLTVFRHRDLFVLQLDTFESIDWVSVAFDSPLGTNLAGHENIRHLAIEFRPEWIDMSRHSMKHFIRTFCDAAFELYGCIHKLWFIDNNLKRRKDAPAFVEVTDEPFDMNVFYASDRKFLEINCFRSEDSLEDWNYIVLAEDNSRGGLTSSHRFVSALSMEIWDLENEHLDDTEHGEDACQVGLLGWDNI
ncbi:hypothetical protein ACHAP7_011630 [Fusarium lateritium]